MTYQGIDTAARLTAEQARKLRENGVSFVARYITPGKSLDAAEITALRDAGLAIMFCWETTAERMKGGARAGAEDSERAQWYARKLGIPAGCVIFFAADYDVPAADFATVEAYLRAARANMDDYTVGLYGPEAVVAEMSRRGSCYYFWQCVAWSNQKLPVADVWQYAWQGAAEAKEMAAKCGILAVDMDSAETLAGMWLPPGTLVDDGEGGAVYIPPNPAGHNDPVGETGPAWYETHMDWMERNGLMMDGRPNDAVTRAELAAVVHRLEEKRYSGLLED